MFTRILVAIIFILSANYSFGANQIYNNKEISIMRMDYRPCVLFQLKDVPDAGGTGSPWFALRDTHIHQKEIMSVLISAKVSGKKVDVEATSTVLADCGHSEVQVVHLP